jgi:hypothetical protein
VELMQSIGFGCIQDLTIRNAEPDFEQPYHVRRKLKMAAARDGPCPKTGSKDFVLRRKIVELFEQFRKMGHGTVSTLEIQHGLPFVIEWTETSPILKRPR